MSKKTEIEDRVSVNKVDIRDEIANSFAAYAKDVIMDRALPDIRDGLLPVQRRIIYGMHKMRLLPTNKQVKSARIVGEVMGKYHPHGDCLDEDTLVYLNTGKAVTIGELYKESQLEGGKTFGVYAVNEYGQLVGATMSDVRIGQYTDEVYHITLSNGYKLSVTANHPFLTYNKEWVKAEDLTINTSLFNARVELGNTEPVADDSEQIIITAIRVEQVDKLPMYDFTVEGVANALFVASDDNKTLISLHNSALYGAMARMSKEWVLRNPLVTMFGNNGSVDGDSPAAMRYCVVGDTLVTLADGQLIAIQDIVPGALPDTDTDIDLWVKDYQGNAVHATKFFHSGEHDTLKITLQNGNSLTGSHNHPVLVLSNEGGVPTLVWKTFEELQPGDYVTQYVEGVSPDEFSHAYSPVTTIEDAGKQHVYSIKVDTEDHSFITNGIVSHNTEARLSKTALKLLEGLNKQGVVDWQKNYDDALDEPQYLPAQFPNILVNGASGISVGYASDIPPHNLKEVLEACIQVLDDPTLTFEQLAIQGPDFPTGGEIINKNELGRIYDVGEGSIRVRAKYYLEETSKRSKYNKLVFYEMPYNVKKPDIVLQIKTLLDQKLLNGVSHVMDDSNKEGIRLVLQVEKGINHASLADVLYQKTNLQANVTYNCVVISDGKPRVLGINELLRRYNKFRVETVRRELEADNEVDRKRLHILDGLLVLADNVKDIISLIEQSKTKDESRQALIGTYNLSVDQANTILELQLHRINQASKEDFLTEHNERTAQLAHRQNILNTKSLLIQYVKDGYEQLIEEFKADTKRLTSVTSEEVKVNVDIESMIQHEEVAVGVTPEGYIKRSSIRSYQSTESEYKGFSIETDTHQHVLIFTNKGNYVYLPVHEIKEGRWGDEGGHLSTIGVEFTEGEKIVSLAEYDEEATVFILRKSGSGKTSLASDFPVSRHTSLYTCGGVDEGDEVIMAGLVTEGDTLAIKTVQELKTKTKKGVFILNVQDLSTIGVKAKGRKIVKLPKTKNIIGCITVESTGEETSFNKGTNEMEVTPVLPLKQYNQAPITFIAEQLLIEPEVVEGQTDDSIVEED